jgi:diguanylate cyclase (GGDEF)-like protein
MSYDSFKDFIAVINNQGIILSMFQSDMVFTDFIGKNFKTLLAEHESKIFDRFLNLIDKNEIITHQTITLSYEYMKYPCRLSGFKEGTNIYIFGIFDSSTDEEVLIKMMKLNSEQVNQLRILNKSLSTLDSKVFEEISKLNSELLNSKRTIEKQNNELQRYNQLLKKMSIEDALTGCYNRRYFHEYMTNEYILSQKDVTNSLVMIDFNNFKKVNDEFGHDTGDRLLIQFVEITKQIIKNKGEIFRIGGDEFIIIFDHMNQDEARLMMKKIDSQFKTKSIVVTLAYGIVSFNESEFNHEFDLSTLIKKADTLMYIDKEQFKHQSNQ